MDTTAAVTAIGDIVTDVGAVGGAVLIVAAAIMTFRWIKAMFF